MEVKSINTFLSYFERMHGITEKVINTIPPDKLEWSYMPGKFTLGDLVRHIAAIERYVFAEVVMGKKPAYKGCGKELADGYDEVMNYYHKMHEETVEILSALSDEDLLRKVPSLDGTMIEMGNFLRALIVHETHHRGAMCIYLNLLGVQTPPILGFSEQQVIAVSR